MKTSKNINIDNSLLDKSFPFKVGVIYSDVKRKYFPTRQQYLTEKEALGEAQIMAKYLKKLGIEARLFKSDKFLSERLKETKLDMVINLTGSVRGNEYLASCIPALLELIEIPYTGSGILGESLSYNKYLVTKLLQQSGVPVPNSQLFNSHKDYLNSELRFPLITKLNEIHGGVEITRDSIVESEKEMRNRLKYLIKTYDQPVLVQEFIVGKEITAVLFQGRNKKVYLAEKKFLDKSKKYKFVDFSDQWGSKGIDSFEYSKYSDLLLIEYVKKAFEVCKMQDYAKFDIRVDLSGRYFFIDSNSNPAFGPLETESAIAYILDLYNIPFIEVLKRLLINTIKNWKGDKLLSYSDKLKNHNTS